MFSRHIPFPAPGPSPLRSPTSPPTDQLPHMQLLPPSTEKSYITLSALIEDINKTTVRQGYNVVKKGGNKKDKNGDLRRICLRCSKGGSYKEGENRMEHETRERRRQRTDCPWKAYAIRKDLAWTIRIDDPEHNHPPSAPEAFASNRKSCQADIAITKDGARANIPPIKTLTRLHNLNPGKYFTIRDLHNARAHHRRQELAYPTSIQHLLQELQTSDLWFTSYQVDGYEQLTHLFFAFEQSLDLLEMYPDILFIDCTYKTNKYNMPPYIFNDITSCNKFFHIGFAFFRHEDKDSYHWMLSRLHELYTRVGQEEEPEVILTDKEDALIAGLEEVMPSSHHMLCAWHINKNIMARATKYFLEPQELKDWMSLWYMVFPAPTVHKYEQAKVELQIRDLSKVAEHRKSLYEYIDGEYLANGNDQKHCYYWTNGITHFNKRVTSAAEGGHANIKRALESTLGDLPEVFKVIREKIEDQLRKVHLKHAYDKNGNIKATLNIGMFRYLRHEISEYALDLMASHAVGVTALSVLPQCTGVFTKTLGLPCKHKIQQSIRDPDQPLRRDDLHPHWWLNPLEDEQPVEPWARIQPPVRTRRRGRPRNPRREPSAFEVAAARARNEAGAGAGAVGNRGQNVRGRGRQEARGGNVGRVRDGDNPRENQPRRVGLRRRLPHDYKLVTFDTISSKPDMVYFARIITTAYLSTF